MSKAFECISKEDLTIIILAASHKTAAEEWCELNRLGQYTVTEIEEVTTVLRFMKPKVIREYKPKVILS